MRAARCAMPSPMANCICARTAAGLQPRCRDDRFPIPLIAGRASAWGRPSLVHTIGRYAMFCMACSARISSRSSHSRRNIASVASAPGRAAGAANPKSRAATQLGKAAGVSRQQGVPLVLTRRDPVSPAPSQGWQGRKSVDAVADGVLPRRGLSESAALCRPR